MCRLIKEKENVFKINFRPPLRRMCYVLLPFYSLRFAWLQLINTKPAKQGRHAFSGRLCCLGAERNQLADYSKMQMSAKRRVRVKDAAVRSA